MTFGSRLTGGLAWAGLALVVGVPVVNMVWPEGGGARNEALSASVEEKTVPVEGTAAPGMAAGKPDDGATATTASARTTIAEAATGYTLPPGQLATSAPAGAAPAGTGDEAGATDVASGDAAGSPVDRYIATGKPLPDYISDGGATDAGGTKPATARGPKVEMTSDSVTIFPEGASEAVAKPESGWNPASASGTATGPTKLASVEPGQASGSPLPASAPTIEPPIPMPVSMRPPTPPRAMKERTATISVGSETDYVDAPPAGDAPSMVVVPVPPGEVRPLPAAPGAPIVTEEELRGWKTGTLADYLRSKGLLEGDSRSEARVRVYRLPRPNGYVDNVPSDGQYYDEGDPGYPYAD